jgi:beta-phosphoglucomutase-like phosphatase (HAD superfamily)
VSGVVAAEQVAAPKPSPAGHLRALARLSRVRPIESALVVSLEDAPDGLAAARAAGVLGVGVGDGSSDATGRDPWVASVADVTYDALVELLANRGVRGS